MATATLSIAGQAALTACGFLAGEQLALDSQLSWEQTQTWGFGGVILVNLAGAGVVAACLVCLFAWQHAAAWGWLRRGVGHRGFQLWFWVSVASCIPAMILCFGEVLALRLYIDGPPLDIATAAQVGPTVAKILASLFAGLASVACAVECCRRIPSSGARGIGRCDGERQDRKPRTWRSRGIRTK